MSEKAYRIPAGKVLLLLSGTAEAFLISRPQAGNILFCAAILLFLSVRIISREERKLKGREYLIPALLQLVLSGHAAINWTRISADAGDAFRIRYITDNPHIAAAVLAGAAAGFYFLARLSGAVLGLRERKENGPAEENRSCPQAAPWSRYKQWGLCFFCSAVLVTACSECSFLYPLNPWVDVNCFLTVGKAMMNGLVPYRDLLEQKGPYLYLLYGLGSRLSPGSYTGVYLLEILSGTAFLFYAGKTAGLMCGNERRGFALVPLLAVLACTSHAFYQGGSAEEFCLPFCMITFYTGLRSVKEGRPVRPAAWAATGLSAGFVLWVKYTVLGLFAGFYLYFLILYTARRQFRDAVRMIAWSFAGLLAATVPVLLYFGMNHALKDLWEVYFHDNIFLYPGLNQGAPLLRLAGNYFRGLVLAVNKNTPAFLLLVLFFSVNRQKHETGYVFLVTAALFLTSFPGRWTWAYYTLAFTPAACAGTGVLAETTDPGKIRGKRWMAVLACLPLCVFLTPNKGLIGRPYRDTVQYRFAEIIRRTESPTLLNYGFLDGGFYRAADIQPTCKAFCRLAAPIPEMYELQEQYVDGGLCDYIVSRKKIKSPLYVRLAAEEGYYLYGLKGKADGSLNEEDDR